MYRKRTAARVSLAPMSLAHDSRLRLLDAPCTTYSDTSELGDHDRELQNTETDQRDRVDEVAHDILLQKVTLADTEPTLFLSAAHSLGGR